MEILPTKLEFKITDEVQDPKFKSIQDPDFPPLAESFKLTKISKLNIKEITDLFSIYEQIFGPNDDWTIEKMCGSFTDPYWVLVYLHDKNTDTKSLIGCVTFDHLDEKNIYLYNLGILEKYRGKGLLNRLVNHMKKNIFNSIFKGMSFICSVKDDNTIVQKYERLGFQKADVSKLSLEERDEHTFYILKTTE